MSARTKVITLSALAVDTDGIAASQTPAGGGLQELTLLAGAANLSPPRRVSITAAANESARTFVVTGLNRYGDPLVETVPGPNIGTNVTNGVFSSVTSITVDDNTAGAVEAGWPAGGVSQWVPLNAYQTPFAVNALVDLVSGSATFSVEATLANVMKEGPDPVAGAVYIPSANLQDETADAQDTINEPVQAIRLTASTGTGELTMYVLQSRPAGV